MENRKVKQDNKETQPGSDGYDQVSVLVQTAAAQDRNTDLLRQNRKEWSADL